jgi:membrane associated rhomboid family serine protease
VSCLYPNDTYIRFKQGPISSNVLGGNFALVVAPSVGASGAIFGTIAVGSFAYKDRIWTDTPLGNMGRSLRSLEAHQSPWPSSE